MPYEMEMCNVNFQHRLYLLFFCKGISTDILKQFSTYSECHHTLYEPTQLLEFVTSRVLLFCITVGKAYTH
jgi:hypothetical protein